MSDATVFKCPSCGASLDSSQKQARCPYCGNTIVLPQEPETLQDLQREQMTLVNSAIQSAMNMESQQMNVATGVAKSTIGMVVGGTVILPLIITAITFIFIICIFGFVFLSFGSMFTSFMR